MCITPLFKKNPYYKADPVKHIMHDTEHEYISIPCGHCDECLAVRQSSYIQRVTMEAKFNHLFFATLTYDNKHLPVLTMDVPVQELAELPSLSEEPSQTEKILSLGDLFNPDGSLCEDMLSEIGSDAESRISEFISDKSMPYDKLSELLEEDYSPRGETELIQIPYADIHHLQLMFKRMRDNNTIGRPFRYLAVSERGSKKGRPHFHIIFFIPKQEGDSLATCEDINSLLKDMLLRFWSTNTGTRKNPVYERNFTYRERWIGRKLYRNFDCHYVNPNLTTEGVSNVAFYVTKYIFKDSDKENKLRQLIWCKSADVAQFYAAWDIVKSRMLCSKGLGLDACFESVAQVSTSYRPAYEYAEDQLSQLRALEDLPSNDFELTPVPHLRLVERKTRLMVPNFELMQQVKDMALLEPASGRAVFVGYNGKHIPLAAYYRRRCLSYQDHLTLYYSWDPVKYPEKPNRAETMPLKERYKIERRLATKKRLIDEHEVLDSNSFDIEKGRSIDPYDPYRGISKYYNLDGKVRTTILLGK